MNFYRSLLIRFIASAHLVAAGLACTSIAMAADRYVPFDGQKTAWHDGFDRYDFLMDEKSSPSQPFVRDADERFGVKGPPKGQTAVRRGRAQGARQPATHGPGAAVTGTTSRKPKSSCCSRGFHVAFITPDPGKPWDAWYALPHRDPRTLEEAGVHRHEQRGRQ